MVLPAPGRLPCLCPEVTVAPTPDILLVFPDSELDVKGAVQGVLVSAF